MVISGTVVKGEAVGRTIGFPTANLFLTDKPKIKPGVYTALCRLGDQRRLGLAYFGKRYIFKEKRDSFEVYLFNFNRNIYGKKLKVKLLKFLRPPQAVKDLTTLKRLLERDLRRLDREVILVNRQDKIIGIEDKIKAHQGQAKLHRAVSVQLFNQRGELLIQLRSKYKRLFPLLWANTVCTDVRPYETCHEAADRRLKEEFGMAARLKPVFKFYYSAKSKSYSEKEIDQVFFGLAKGRPQPDAKEIADWKWVELAEARRLGLKTAPWFKRILKNTRPSDILVS